MYWIQDKHLLKDIFKVQWKHIYKDKRLIEFKEKVYIWQGTGQRFIRSLNRRENPKLGGQIPKLTNWK